MGLSYVAVTGLGRQGLLEKKCHLLVVVDSLAVVFGVVQATFFKHLLLVLFVF